MSGRRLGRYVLTCMDGVVAIIFDRLGRGRKKASFLLPFVLSHHQADREHCGDR